MNEVDYFNNEEEIANGQNIERAELIGKYEAKDMPARLWIAAQLMPAIIASGEGNDSRGKVSFEIASEVAIIAADTLLTTYAGAGFPL